MKYVALSNILLVSATLDTSHFDMSPLNSLAERNIPDMSFTLDTSHFETSPINTAVSEKRRAMFLMLDTSHSPIGTCEPLGHSHFGDKFRHVSTAFLSSGLDCGENAGVGRGWGSWGRGEAVGLSSKFRVATTKVYQSVCYTR